MFCSGSLNVKPAAGTDASTTKQKKDDSNKPNPKNDNNSKKKKKKGKNIKETNYVRDERRRNRLLQLVA